MAGPHATDFVGRQRELAALQEAANRALAGQGTAVFVAGEEGMGKTRFAQEAVNRIESGGALALRARCLPDAPAPYLPLIEALRPAGLAHLLLSERPPRLEYLYLSSPHGLTMASAQRSDQGMDRDLFISMLSAVESFVTDSLAGLVDGERAAARRLNALGFGEFRIVLFARPYGSLVAILRGQETEDLVTALEEVADVLEQEFGDALVNWDGDRSLRADFSRPLVRLLESGRFDGAERELAPQDRKYKVLEGLSRGLVRASERQPMALLLDDLHLADSATLAAVGYLARSLRQAKFLLVATYRSDDLVMRSPAQQPFVRVRAALQSEGLLQEVALEPLDEENLRVMAAHELGARDVDPALVEAVLHESAGAPFAALDLLRSLSADDAVERIGGEARLRGGTERATLRPRLRESVQRRVEKLPRSERDVLECAAVDGEVFSPTRVACALDLRKLNLMRTLRNLEEDHRLMRIAGETASFDHAKTREAVYASIHPDLRREYHRAIAECCVKQMAAEGKDLTEAAAFHFARAREPSGKQYILKAAQRAFAASSHEEAAEWFEAFIPLGGEEVTGEVMANYGSALLIGGRFEKAEKVFERLVEAAPDEAVRLDHLRHLAESVSMQRGLTRALELLDRYEPKAGSPAWARWAVHRSLYAQRSGKSDRAERDLSVALPLLEAAGGGEEIAEADFVMATIGEGIGDYDMAIEYARKAIAAVPQNSARLPQFYSVLGRGLLLRGRYDECNQTLRTGLELAQMTTDLSRLALISNYLGMLAVRRGDPREARAHLLPALRWGERIESPYLVGMALDQLGLAAAEEGRDQDAAEFYRRALPITDSTDDKPLMTALRIHLALLELERGDPVLALEHAEQAYRIAAGSGDAPGQAVSRAIQAGATGITGDPEEALRLFGDAARGLRTSPSQYEYAEILRMWGEFLLDLAQLEPATDKLTAAYEVFKKLGAAGRMRLVAESLTAIGSGPADSH